MKGRIADVKHVLIYQWHWDLKVCGLQYYKNAYTKQFRGRWKHWIHYVRFFWFIGAILVLLLLFGFATIPSAYTLARVQKKSSSGFSLMVFLGMLVGKNRLSLNVTHIISSCTTNTFFLFRIYRAKILYFIREKRASLISYIELLYGVDRTPRSVLEQLGLT